MEGGRVREPRVSVSRSMFALVDDQVREAIEAGGRDFLPPI